METNTTESTPEWLVGARFASFLGFIIMAWFVLPMIRSVPLLFTVLAIITWYAYFSVSYLWDFWVVLPDERPGLFRYLAEMSRIGILESIWFWILIFSFMGFVFREDDTMETILKKGDRVLWTPIAYSAKPPARGDIVMLTTSNGEFLIRRIVGVPNETLEVVDGRVIIHGETLDEPYMSGNGEYSVQPRKLGSDEYAVLPDRRIGSMQENIVIRRDAILGQAFLRISPLRNFGLLPTVNYASVASEKNDKGKASVAVVIINISIALLATIFLIYRNKALDLTWIKQNWPLIICISAGLLIYWYWLWPVVATHTALPQRWIGLGIWLSSWVIVLTLNKSKQMWLFDVIMVLAFVVAFIPLIPFLAIYYPLKYIRERYITPSDRFNLNNR